MMNIKFLLSLTILLTAFSCLCYSIYSTCIDYPEILFLLIFQGWNTLACYILIGVGLGFPLVIIATIFGWVHLILLINGYINPHLSGKGFSKALSTLFDKIYSLRE